MKIIGSYNPVEIAVRNDNSFLSIALLVDDKHFIEELISMRDYFELSDSLAFDDYQAWNKHLYKIAGFTDIEIEEVINIPTQASKDNFFESREIQRDEYNRLKTEFEDRIALIRDTFGYPSTYDQVIKEAVLFNKIVSIPKPVSVTVLKSTDKGLKNLHEQNAILFEPYATKRDILKAFEEWQSMNKERQADKLVSSHLYRDTKPQAERDRSWFWQRYSDQLSYEEILQSWNNLCPDEGNHDDEACMYCKVNDINIVEQAVKRYKNMFSSSSLITS